MPQFDMNTINNHSLDRKFEFNIHSNDNIFRREKDMRFQSRRTQVQTASPRSTLTLTAQDREVRAN